MRRCAGAWPRTSLRYDSGAAMTEWWTYRPSDFLLFSPRTYYRLFELYNAEVWPGHLLALGLGLALWLALWQRRAWAPRAACVLLAAAWLWVAWAFHWQRMASINWAASWFAAAFAIQGLLLCVAATTAGGRSAAAPCPSRHAGLALLLFALLVQPALGTLLDRSWQQAELFGLAPDPTALATLGVLLLRPRAATHADAALKPTAAWWLWPIPLLWCGVTGMTLAAMQSADAMVMPGAALVAVAALWRARVT